MIKLVKDGAVTRMAIRGVVVWQRTSGQVNTWVGDLGRPWAGWVDKRSWGTAPEPDVEHAG